MERKMTAGQSKEEIILAALSASQNAVFQPVQIQKFFFLIDQKVSHRLGGKLFNFEPYHYGPFDKAVYTELDKLAARGLVEISSQGLGRKSFQVTYEGRKFGEAALLQLGDLAKYLSELSNFVRSMSFDQLVRTIYSAYPDMKKNSVFNE